MKNIAFALDPDGYWVELIGQEKLGKSQTDVADYRFNHTMFRIKDPKVSLKFRLPSLQENLLIQVLRRRNWNATRSKIRTPQREIHKLLHGVPRF